MAPGAREPNGIRRFVTHRVEQTLQFPALLAIFATVALALATIGFGSMGVLPLTQGPRARWARVALVFVILFGSALAACGKKSTATTSTATPIATTTMNVVASATDSSGNTINAGRGLQIVLDVIKQQVQLP